MRISVARTLSLFLAVCGLAAFSIAPASAHDRIISSDPTDGAELAVSPAQIALTFSDDVQALGGQILVTDSAGAQVASGAPSADGTVAALALPRLANGSYTATWRVVSSDGHPIDGTFAFSVADPAAVEPAPEVTALEEPAVEPTATTSEPTLATTADGSAADTVDKDPLPWTGIIIGGLLGVAGGVGILAFLKHRKAKE